MVLRSTFPTVPVRRMACVPTLSTVGLSSAYWNSKVFGIGGSSQKVLALGRICREVNLSYAPSFNKSEPCTILVIHVKLEFIYF